MADTAATQLRRVLQLIPQLTDGDEHSVNDIAERLGVDRKVLLSDLVSVTQRFDEPGGFVEGVSVTWDDENVSALTSHFLRPMRLSMRELCALELGLALIRRERTPDEVAPIDRALVRLREAISKVPANDLVEGVRHADLDAPGSEYLPVFRAAITARRKLQLRYLAGAATEASDRSVCPHSLAFAHGMWYLVAYCEKSEGVRFFRLDRVEHVESAPGTFARVAEALPDNRFYQGGEGASTMTVRYSPRIAHWIAEREGRAVDGDGSITIEHPMADENWAVRHVLQYGPEAEVVEPESLRDALKTRLTAMKLAQTTEGA